MLPSCFIVRKPWTLHRPLKAREGWCKTCFFACPYSPMLCSCSGAGTGLPSPPLPACRRCLFSTCTLRSSLALLSLRYFAISPHRRQWKKKMKQFTVIPSRSGPKQRKGAQAQGPATETWEVLSPSQPRGPKRMGVSFPEQKPDGQTWGSWQGESLAPGLCCL